MWKFFFINVEYKVYFKWAPDFNLQVFAKGVDPDTVVLMAARASRTENQDAIDCAIVGMLADPKEVIIRCYLCASIHICSSSYSHLIGSII